MVKVLIHFTATCGIHWMCFVCLLVCVFMEYQVDEAVHTAIQPAVVACCVAVVVWQGCVVIVVLHEHIADMTCCLTGCTT